MQPGTGGLHVGTRWDSTLVVQNDGIHALRMAHHDSFLKESWCAEAIVPLDFHSYSSLAGMQKAALFIVGLLVSGIKTSCSCTIISVNSLGRCLPDSPTYYGDIKGVTQADRDKRVTLTWAAG